MDLTLSTTELALADKARNFCEQVLQPLEMVVEEHGILPDLDNAKVKDQVREWGLAGINHKTEHGGLGLTAVEQVVMEEQLGRATNGLWTTVWRPPVSLVYGTEQQIDKYLIPCCRGDIRACFAITEPDSGSDNKAVKTTAVRDGDGWRLNGEKWFVTGFNGSQIVIVHAHVDDDANQPTLFIVPKTADGLLHQRSPKFMHNYAFDHAELLFEDCYVPDADRLGEIGSGFDLTKNWFVEARLQIAAHSLGAAIRASEEANKFAESRVQFGQPIGNFQAIEFMLADMAVDIFAAKSMLYRVAAEMDRGLDRKVIHARASALKLFCSEMAGRVIDKSVQIFGGRGYMRENSVERAYRDIRVDRIWEGTSEIQRIVIAGQIKKRGMDVYAGW